MGSPKVPHCTSLHVSEQLLLKPNRQCFCPQLMQGKPPAVLTAIAKSFSLPRVLPCVSSTLSVAETSDLLTHFLMLGLPPGGGSEKSSHYWQCSVYIDNQYILVNANYFVTYHITLWTHLNISYKVIYGMYPPLQWQKWHCYITKQKCSILGLPYKLDSWL